MEEKDNQKEDIEEIDNYGFEADDEDVSSSRSGMPWLILLIALAIVGGASFVPWSRITDGKIKDFNLFSDLINLSDSTAKENVEQIDPELFKAQQEQELNRQSSADLTDTIIQPVKSNKLGELTIFEDYTSGNHGLSRFKAALADSTKVARIAIVGDSYIEGDIMCQNLRAKLQTQYGGNGAGYMNMQSPMASFRRSIKQAGSGWKASLAKGKCNYDFMGLAQQYQKPSPGATSTYNGVTTLPHLEQWSSSKFLFIAPNNTTISIKAAGEWSDHQVTGKPGVQCITIDTLTTDFDVKVNDPALIALGVYLDGTCGVAVDCMSSRGFSGVQLTKISSELCHQMAQFVDYDLIILEFGINAMSAGQTNYSVYQNRMVEVINHVRECYPKADVLLMGIGDRGERVSGNVRSMKTCVNMVTAQRDAARQAHCVFWDTREAMGGENAIVRWAQEGYANKDYIHMTHKGGDRLATELFNALQHALK